MLLLRELNFCPQKEYEYITSVPADENGFFNDYFGAPKEGFEETVLQILLDHSEGLNLPSGYVPETHFLLWDDDNIVGWFRLRHYLNDSLREGAGHIGYSIREEHRGKGYATKGLGLLIEKAVSIVSEDTLFLRVNKNNPASLKVMKNNGGKIHHEDAEKYYVRIPLEPKRPTLQPVIDNIVAMEDRLNKGKQLVETLSNALEEYNDYRKELDTLFSYYGSEQWFCDRELSNKKKLPKGLRCGVLSEDAVYDLLSEEKELLQKIQEIIQEK